MKQIHFEKKKSAYLLIFLSAKKYVLKQTLYARYNKDKKPKNDKEYTTKPFFCPIFASMKIIECPRDAMQGMPTFIPTDRKIEYINTLLQVGFDTIDVGSFVSAKSVPQMRDTRDVLRALRMEDTDSKLLAIVANTRGATEASDFEAITYLGFPFSISEIFQQRNTNASQEKAFRIVGEILDICIRHDKELVVYLSMCFGNPYGEFWDPALVEHWADRFASMGVATLSLSDTVGVATSDMVGSMVGSLTRDFPRIEFGVHLHSRPNDWREKIEAAYRNGCERFDGALSGYGGCPFAQDALVGNIATENLVAFFEEERADFFVDPAAFEQAKTIANQIFLDAAKK